MSFTTYLESWSKPQNVVNQMIAAGALTNNSRLVLAFASFNFTSQTYIPGDQNMSLSDVQALTNLVLSRGARISLSIGGATYPFLNSDLYNQPGDLATNIDAVLTRCGFDGVDFDIEDSYASVPQDFAQKAAAVINSLRALNGGLYISLTTPAQAWSSGMYQQSLLNFTYDSINAWQPMEYDLWLAPAPNGTGGAVSYVDQIKSDVNYYIKSWSVQPSKLILGLMPGADDMGHNLSLQDTLNLTSFSQATGLQGIMTWDANLDAAGRDQNAPFAYMMGIQSQLSKAPVRHSSLHYTTTLHHL
jgi:chitinase